jgi:hypothetical protein
MTPSGELRGDRWCGCRGIMVAAVALLLLPRQLQNTAIYRRLEMRALAPVGKWSVSFCCWFISCSSHSFLGALS